MQYPLRLLLNGYLSFATFPVGAEVNSNGQQEADVRP